MARQYNATAFMVVQAALAVLLGKLGGTSDVAVGFPIAGRSDPVLDDLVGFFVNTLVLRVDLGGDPTVAEMLARVRGRSLEAFEHQDVPFEVLVERLNPTRSLTHHPPFQVALGWQNFAENRGDPTAAMALGDVQISPLDADIQTARWDLTFQLAERFTEAGQPAGIGGWWSFAPMSSMRPVSRFWRRGCVGCLRRWLLIRASICRASMCSMTLSTLSSIGGATGLRSTSPRRCGCRSRRCSPSRWPPPRSDSDHLRRAVTDLRRTRRGLQPVGALSG